jgi:orotate phosphoribosyltransferase
VFETSSGRFHDEFITLWELFDERDLFSACIDQLAALARRVRVEKGYTTIVTSTATAKHLVEYVHARIESADDRITLRYLGPYPFLGSGNREVINFNGEKVLIIADVIDSGTVVKNLAKAVRDLNGLPVAALCLVLVNEGHIGRMNDQGEVLLPIETDAEEDEKYLRVHSLSDYPIAEVAAPEEATQSKDAAADRWELIKIDPESLLPILPPPRTPGIAPAIDAVAMYRQLEEADAIAFDFFVTEAGFLTTAVRFEKLFRPSADAIWAAVRRHFQAGEEHGPPLVVSTYDWGDVQFKEFVEDRLTAEGRRLPVILAGRRDSGEYFILDHYHDRLFEQRVVLLLSSVQSGEKVRHLATLLAGLQVREIRVVCLLNRMGRQTAESIRRTQILLRGLGDVPDNPVPFTFHPVYCLSDLSSDDIRCARDTVHTLLAHYQGETRVPGFHRCATQVRAYFEPKPLTSFEFTDGRGVPLDPPAEVELPGGEKITVRTEDAKLSILCGHVAADRNYDPILDELVKTTRKQTLYKLFAVLLADISYLRMLCRFKKLKLLLQDRVEKSRAERLSLEKAARDRGQELTAAELARLDEVIELEMYLLFGWALVSYLDQHFDYDQLAWDVVTGGPAASDGEQYPVNFDRYYGEERVAWTVSMLLLLSHPRFRTARRTAPIRERLVGALQNLVARVRPDPAPGGPAGAGSRRPGLQQARLLKIKSNLDMLLTEMGTFELRQPVDVIRYLHSLFLKTRQQHSPLVTSMNEAVQAVRRAVRQSMAGPAQSGAGLDLTNRRVHITAADQLARLDDGVHIAGQLQTVADAVNRLFFFSPGSAEKAERFLAAPDKPGFAADVVAFGDSLQAIRRDKWVSPLESEELTELRRVILRDLWADISLLRATLSRYVVALEPTLVLALLAARRSFRKLPFVKVWDKQIAKWARVPKSDWHYVLVEPLVLREVLKNVLTNVRHTLEGVESPKKGFSRLVKIAIGEEVMPPVAGEEATRKWVVRVVSKGNVYAPGNGNEVEETTLDQHRREIAKYGGELRIDRYSGKRRKGAEVELRLISRNDVSPTRGAPEGESDESTGLGRSA